MGRRAAKVSWLVEPTYGYAAADGTPYLPGWREVLREWLDAINVFESPYRVSALTFAAFHLLTALAFIVGFHFLTWKTIVWGFIVHQIVSLTYHTLWYHRYCTHGAFRFSSLWFPRLLLWTNPVVLKEEAYAIGHRVHHQRPDSVGDPYGPHLGWFGSYLSWESLYKTNVQLSEREYGTLARSFRHLGMPLNSYDAFRRTGSVEQLWHYFTRMLVAQGIFIGISYAVGGPPFVLAAYGGLFVFTFLLREFSWRGHGGNFRTGKIEGWEFDRRSRSINSRFYGYLAAEWHDNHHRLPTSANCAILPGQVDVIFLLIRALHAVGIVSSYHDAATPFRAQLRS